MTVEELKNEMRNGYVNFKYTKKNGDERLATGTLNIDIIASENATPSGNWNSGSESSTRYYDKNAGGWRSFVNTNFIDICE